MSVEAAVEWRDRQVSAAERSRSFGLRMMRVFKRGDHSLSIKTDAGVEELTILF
jgi:hypothetical protein